MSVLPPSLAMVSELRQVARALVFQTDVGLRGYVTSGHVDRAGKGKVSAQGESA